MAKKQLYPVFEVPDFVAKKNEENRKQQYKPSVYFDYATGDFRLDGAGRMAGASGREAYMQWCIKTVMTERDAFLAYSTKYGAELETSLAQSDRASVEASLERTITEAIMANPKTEYCRDFTFTWPEPDSCDCEFVVKGRGYDEIQTVSLNFSK